MPKRSRKPSHEDVNQAAARIVHVTVTQEEQPPQVAHVIITKDPAAVSLGRRGGLKGGPARAAKLSARRKRAIAKKAARVRWSKRK